MPGKWFLKFSVQVGVARRLLVGHRARKGGTHWGDDLEMCPILAWGRASLIDFANIGRFALSMATGSRSRYLTPSCSICTRLRESSRIQPAHFVQHFDNQRRAHLLTATSA